MESQISKTMNILQWILGIFLAISISYFVIGELFSEKESYFKVGLSDAFNEGWEMVLDDGSKVSIDVPGSYDVDSGELFVIEKELPSDFEGTWICIRSSQQDIKFFVDGELRKEYSTKGTRKFGKNSVSVYVFAELYPEDAGKTLRMEMVSHSTYAGYIGEIYSGDREQIWTGIVKRHLPVTILALFMLLLSVMVVIYTLIIHIVYKKAMNISYLGVGLLVASVWLIAESKLRQIFLPNSTIASDVGFFMIMLLPFPFLAYINKIQRCRYEKGYAIIAICTAINYVVSTVLQLADIKDFSETMGVAHIIIIALIFMLFTTVIIDIKKKRISEYKEVSFGLAGLMIAGIFEVYMVYDRFAIYNGVALCIGLAFLFFMAVIQTGKDLLQLEKDKQIAVAASESRAMFLANMSHEIRTPINTIVGMNEMILRNSGDESTREYAKNIDSASKMLMSLIDDILDFSKLDAGRIEIDENDYDVAMLVDDVILSAKVRLQDKALNFNIDIDEKLPSVLKGDEIRIKQVYNNILSNAIKYTEEGNIDISLKGIYEKGVFYIVFSVSDTGVGIREEDIPTLFDSFQRMDLKRNKYIQGTGLGLNITKQLVDYMNGTIDVKSEYGKGSCFTIKLPQIIVDETPVKDHSEMAVTDRVDVDIVNKEKKTFPNKSVLVVDDNDMNLTVMKALLSNSGLKLDFASSGLECIDKCKKEKYDLIFMDHMMPDPDGIETLHIIKEDEEGLNKDTTVVVLTANAIKGAAEQYEKEGFADYITKPVEYEKMEVVLEKYLETKDEREDNMEDIYNIDIDAGINYCGGMEDLYYEILGDYIDKTKEYKEEINGYYLDENWKEYARISHTLKSTSLTVGVNEFSELAKKHEFAAKEENIQFIKSGYKEFVDAIGVAILSAQSILDKK
ncbi:MAG: response regulator [Lachnospiraceae bacterium]|nr:response regulator [Lachnospiraceae bacterium]